MNYIRAIGLGVTLTALSLTASASDEQVRFGSSGFLKSFDAFAEEQLRLLRNDEDDNSSLLPDTVEFSVDFSLDSRRNLADTGGFLYLQELPESTTPQPAATAPQAQSSAFSFTPRGGVGGRLDRMISPSGDVRTTRTFTPRQAGGRVAVAFKPKGDSTPEKKTLAVALSSTLSIDQVDNFRIGDTSVGLTPFEQRSYGLGLDVGYWGFNVGASMISEQGGIDGDFEGFDVGLGYSWANWSTEVSFAEFRQSSNSLSHSNLLDQDFYTLELGAAYNVSNSFRLSGGVRYYQYGRTLAEAEDAAQRAGILYLGTRLSF